MSCPFYGAAIIQLQQTDWAFVPPNNFRAGNRCALITDAHSPCFMEVHEGLKPDWGDCPRNPKLMVDAQTQPALFELFRRDLFVRIENARIANAVRQRTAAAEEPAAEEPVEPT